MARAVADADPVTIETAASRFGRSKQFLAPVAWAAGTLVLAIRGIKLLVLNWRLSLIQVVPAAWIWLVMYQLKQHSLRGVPFRHLTVLAAVLIIALSLVVSIAAFWCNVVFAFAIDEPPPPQIRPAVQRAHRHWTRILGFGVLLGAALGCAAVLIPRIDSTWLYIITLGAILSVMLVSFVAVPARILGRRPQKLPPKQAIGRTATGWALSGVAMSPGFLLDRLGLIMIGVPGLRILGFLVLSVGTALYAAGMSSVKAIKMSIKLGVPDPPDPPPP
jgi:hypothetical protein